MKSKKLLMIMDLAAIALLLFITAVTTTKAESTDVKETETAQTEIIVVEAEPIQEQEEKWYTDEEAYLLAQLVYAEAGSEWIPDRIQQYVASVVLNRMNDSRFPDTIRDVIYDTRYGIVQYATANEKLETCVPNERTLANVIYVLDNGSILPKNVIYQSNSILGSIYYVYQDPYLGNTYFCTG